jgi:CDP-glycerol glycerophosphotransferase (TagB/SpsB family)
MQETEEEQYAKEHGWSKIIGFKIDLEQMRDLPDDWDFYYFAKDDLDDMIEVCEFWKHEDDEEVFEDIDQLIEYIEESSEENLDDWKNRQKMLHL